MVVIFNRAAELVEILAENQGWQQSQLNKLNGDAAQLELKPTASVYIDTLSTGSQILINRFFAHHENPGMSRLRGK